MARAKHANDDPLILKAIATTAAVARDVLEFAIGKTTKINVSLRNQEDLPDYPLAVSGLPPQLQEKLDDVLDQWMEKRIVPTTAKALTAGESREGRRLRGSLA